MVFFIDFSLGSSSRILPERPVTASENNYAGVDFDTFASVLILILIFAASISF